MRNEKKPSRPQASETHIREMHDRAAAAGARAAQHDFNAENIIAEAESAHQQMCRDAVQRREERMEHARKMAADMIAQAEAAVAQAKAAAAQHVTRAEADAEEERRGREAQAEENLRQAHLVAQQERDKQAAEQRDRDYWTWLATDQAIQSGLSGATPTLVDGELDVRGAEQ